MIELGIIRRILGEYEITSYLAEDGTEIHTWTPKADEPEGEESPGE